MPGLPRFFACVALAGCLVLAGRDEPEPVSDGAYSHRLARTVDDPAGGRLSEDEFLISDQWRLVLGQGSGLMGLNLVEISSDGRISVTFSDDWLEAGSIPSGAAPGPAVWRRAEFRVEPEVIAALRQRVVELDLLSLKLAYHGNAVDGTQWVVAIEAADRRKLIYCDNHFPEPVVRLSRWIHQQILRPNATALEQAAPLDAAQARRPDTQLSDDLDRAYRAADPRSAATPRSP